MDGFIEWDCPVDLAVLEEAFRVLQERQLLVGAFDNLQGKTFGLYTYSLQQALHGTELFILIDRNLLSFVKEFALGKCLAARNRIDLGALMVVAMVHDISFEPCIALYEYADSHDNLAVSRDLQIFHHADNLPLRIYVDLLFQRIDRLPAPRRFINGQDSVPNEYDFTVPLKTWNFNYPLLLKIAQLERTQLKPEERMVAYLDWMWSEYIFSGPATAFGIMFLSPGRCGHKKMIKDLFCSDRSRRSAGLRNACWDLCLMQEWMKRLRQQDMENRLWLLASADKALSHAACRLTMSNSLDEQQLTEAKKGNFCEAWGQDRGMKLYLHYRLLLDTQNSSRRMANSPQFSREYCDQLSKRIEDEILS